MTRIFIIIAFIIMSSCKAQTILPLYKGDRDVEGAYYKDTFNDLDNFVGTWEYVNGNTSLRVTFQKIIFYHDTFSNSYYDMLIGEYRYIENGTEKINTLDLLIDPPDDSINHSIEGRSIIGNDNAPICNDCTVGQKRMSLGFEDPSRNEVEGLYGNLIVRRADTANVQKIKTCIMI